MADDRAVAGHCPACQGESLFLGEGGHVTCSRLDCPAPCAVDDLLTARTDTHLEWGHRLAASYLDRETFGDANDIRGCWDYDAPLRRGSRPYRTTPCGDPSVNGYPQDHLWRRVAATDWQAGNPAVRSA